MRTNEQLTYDELVTRHWELSMHITRIDLGGHAESDYVIAVLKEEQVRVHEYIARLLPEEKARIAREEAARLCCVCEEHEADCTCVCPDCGEHTFDDTTMLKYGHCGDCETALWEDEE